MITTEAELRVLLGLFDSATDLERATLLLVHPAAENAVKQFIQYDPEQDVRTELLPRHKLYGGYATRREPHWDVFGERAVAIASSTITDTIQVRHLPIRRIVEIRVDSAARHGQLTGAFSDSTIWTPGEQYHVDLDEVDVSRSGLIHGVTAWPTEPGTIRVIHRCGYSPDEFAGRAVQSKQVGDVITTKGVDASGIKHAVHLTAVKMFETWFQHAKKARAGFTAGPLQSERLQDYSYVLGSKLAEAIAGMGIDMPHEARQAAEPYVNWGLDRL